MALWYCGSTKWTAVTAWAALTAYIVGDLRRQLAAPTVGNERVWRCTTAGTSGAAEPSWTLTKGSTTADATVVWTEVTGNSTYAWTAPHARLANAFAWMAAGDDCAVSHAHAETQATSITLTSPGTAASPCRVYCVNDAGSTPPVSADLATTATVTCTGNTVLAFGAGYAYVYGITFSGGTTTSTQDLNFGVTSTAHAWVLETCTFKFGGTSNSPAMNIGQSGTGNQGASLILWINCTVRFEATGQHIELRKTRFSWLGGSLDGAGTIPTTLFAFSGGPVTYVVSGVDLSASGSGKNLASVSAASPAELRLTRCKLGASVALTTGTPVGQSSPMVWLDNCDSADTNYRMQRSQYEGDVYSETTIVRTGGASDGTTALSHKMVSANGSFFSPLPSPDIAQWNDTTGGAKTLTVEIVHDSVTALNDDEVWLEVEYLGTSGVPLSLFASDRSADILATPAAQTSSSATWTTTGLANPNKQKLAVTVTPQEKGIFRARVMLAKASYTCYVDPVLAVA